MRESFAIDREKLYGFDYDNTAKEAAAWVQNDKVPVFEEATEAALVVEESDEEIVEEISAKEAFFEFARGPQTRPPQVHPHPMPTVPPRPAPHPPRPPHVQPHPMPVVPPRPPMPGPGHNFNPNSGSAPRFAPPAFTPQRAPGLRAVDPRAISRCLYSNTYVWLSNRQEFWFFPTFVGRKSIAGYRWMHRHWVFMGFGLNMVDSFFCGGR